MNILFAHNTAHYNFTTTDLNNLWNKIKESSNQTKLLYFKLSYKIRNKYSVVWSPSKEQIFHCQWDSGFFKRDDYTIHYKTVSHSHTSSSDNYVITQSVFQNTDSHGLKLQINNE